MTLGLAFYIIMLIWLIFGIWWHFYQTAPPYSPGLIGGNLMLFILLLLLGWAVFGPPVRG